MYPEVKLIKKLCKELFVLPIHVVMVDTNRLESSTEKMTIYIPKNWFHDNSNDEMLSWAKELYDERKFDIKIDMHTFGIMHEVGHLMSRIYYKRYKTALTHYYKQVEELMHGKLTEPMDDKTRFFKYRKFKFERVADDCAYIVYKSFEDRFIELDNELKKIF